jgi:uncharacterized membrane protein (DUF485 family)
MKKGKAWVGYLMGIIAIIAVATILIVWIVTAVRDHDAKKQLEQEQQVKELVEKNDTIPDRPIQ